MLVAIRRPDQRLAPSASLDRRLSGRPEESPQELSRVFEGRVPETSWDGPLLSFDNVAVSFGGVVALAGLTFDVAPRSIVAVVGPNGAGKTTLLNAACGMLSRVTGDIRLRDKRILGKSPEDVVLAGIGRSFQHPPLLDSESVLENVLVGEHVRLGYRMADQILRRRKVERQEKEARERVGTILKFLDLEKFRDQPAGGLPYGTRKLIDIARAVASGPQILLLDEPTSGLDNAERESVASVLTAIHQAAPVSILLVEHHMDIVRDVAQQVVALDSGRVYAAGTVQEVLDSDAFKERMVGGTTRHPSVAREEH